jgi:hypothetical protein
MGSATTLPDRSLPFTIHYLPFTTEKIIAIYYSLFTIHQRKEEHIGSSIQINCSSRSQSLSTRRLDIDVYLCAAAATKQTSSKHEERDCHDDHEDHQDGDNTRAAATTTITIICHEATPPVVGGNK